VEVTETSDLPIERGDAWRYLKGTREPSPDPLGGAPTLAWTGIDFDDSGWLTGPTGIGYGDGDLPSSTTCSKLAVSPAT
jgi:hypothetical protein